MNTENRTTELSGRSPETDVASSFQKGALNERKSLIQYFVAHSPGFLGTWIIIYLLILLRAANLVQHPSFWAEDGTFFFKEALEMGFHSIFTPIVGHYHTIPRVIAFLGTFIPVAQIPLFYILTAGLLSSACCAYFVRPGFCWILKPAWARFVTAIGLSVLPGSEEVLLSLCNCFNVIFVFIGLYLLERDESSNPKKLAREILFSTVWFSCGQGIVFLPALLFDLWKKKWERLISLSTLCVSVVANIQATRLVAATTEHTLGFGSIGRINGLFTIYLDNLFMRFLYKPMIGTYLARFWAQHNHHLFYFVSAAVLSFLAYQAYVYETRYREEIIRFYLIILSTTATFSLIAFVRPYSHYSLFKEVMRFYGRYCFQPSILGVIFWVCIVKSFYHPELLTKGRKIFFSLLCILIAWNFIFHEIWIAPHFVCSFEQLESFDEIWPQRAAAIEAAIKAVRIDCTSPRETIGSIPCRPIWWHSQIDRITIAPLSGL